MNVNYKSQMLILNIFAMQHADSNFVEVFNGWVSALLSCQGKSV